MHELHTRYARDHRDEVFISHIQRVWHANLQVYGADKVWKQMNREGLPVRRCTVERTMRRLRRRRVRSGKIVRTTVGDSKATCPLDGVNRQFGAERPNQLCERFHLRLDLAGLAVRRLRERCLRAAHRELADHTDFVLDALEQALYARRPERDGTLVCHTDRALTPAYDLISGRMYINGQVEETIRNGYR